MTFAEVLPHANGLLSVAVVVLLLAGRLALRRSEPLPLHPRLMLSAVATGAVFLVGYVLQVIQGQASFQGEGWAKTAFSVLLLSHTVLAVTVAPLVLRTVYLGWTERIEEHRRLARWTWAIWLYVSVTGVAIHFLVYH